MLDLSRLDLEEIATALADQTDYEHRWLINPQTGEIVFWTADGGIDGQTPVDLDELDLVCIGPLPSYVWYQDMADFAEGISDDQAGRRLWRAIQGKGAFRRFKDELHEEYAYLLPAWYTFRDIRAKRRAVEWLADSSLVDNETANRFMTGHPDPLCPRPGTYTRRSPLPVKPGPGRTHRVAPSRHRPSGILQAAGIDPASRRSRPCGKPEVCSACDLQRCARDQPCDMMIGRVPPPVLPDLRPAMRLAGPP
jgi:hypothetical protein